jgi:hypothetical protein
MMARLDVEWHAHPRLLKLGLAAMGLHAWSISYCDFVRSDGFIPAGAWPSLPGVARAVIALVHAGFWEPAGSGYMLHDYTHYNRTRAAIEAEQATDRVRKNSGRNPSGIPPESERKNGDIPTGIRTENRPESDRIPRAPGPGPGLINSSTTTTTTRGVVKGGSSSSILKSKKTRTD